MSDKEQNGLDRKSSFQAFELYIVIVISESLYLPRCEEWNEAHIGNLGNAVAT